MREIITFCVGSCGNNMGEQFWSFIHPEHGLDSSGRNISGSAVHEGRISTYFCSSYNENYWFPRSIWADLDTSAVDKVQGGEIGRMVNPDLVVTGKTGAGNNWAVGHYTEGAEIVDQLLDNTRKQAEYCDSLHGFQMMHSLGGGTGSGFGTLALDKIREEYPGRISASFSVIPSSLSSDIIVEPYNVVLSMHLMVNYTDLSVLLDNESLEKICSRTLKLTQPTFADFNYIAATAMSNLTCGFRLPGQLNSDWRKFTVNLIPFPRMHFLVSSFAPFTSRGYQSFGDASVENLVQETFDMKNMMSEFNPRDGQYLTGCFIFRGQASTGDIEEQAHKAKDRELNHFSSWIPDNLKISLCDVPMIGVKTCSSFLGNSTAICTKLINIRDKFNKLFRRKAFLHYFTTEGMDEMEFTEAESNFDDLQAEYVQYGQATIEQEDRNPGTDAEDEVS